MAVDFTDEHKTESKYFGVGKHKVKIMLVSSGVNTNDKEFIEFTVVGEDGEEGSAKMYFSTDKAIGYTFRTVRDIFVHNAQEANKDKVRAMVDAVKNSDELVDLCQKLIGKEAWYLVEKTNDTYQAPDGTTKFRYNRNIFGYEPKEKPAPATPVSGTFDGAEEVHLNDGEVPF